MALINLLHKGYLYPSPLQKYCTWKNIHKGHFYPPPTSLNGVNQLRPFEWLSNINFFCYNQKFAPKLKIYL